MSFVEILKVIVLGIVEGFTEWLPISSTGHLILVENIVHLNVSEDFMNVFRVVIQLGAILAVLVLYFRRLNPFDPGKKPAQKRESVFTAQIDGAEARYNPFVDKNYYSLHSGSGDWASA